MRRKESPKERIERINREFSAMIVDIGKRKDETQIAETTPFDLMTLLGLTAKEANAWLKKEPNYTADESLHEPRCRRRFDRI